MRIDQYIHAETNRLAKISVNHFNHPYSVTNSQIKTIWKFLERQVGKRLKLDRLEATLDGDDKKLYFIWGKIKREYLKGDTFTWSIAKAAKICHCSRKDIKPIMKRL